MCADAVGARDYCSPRSYRPVPDRLYRNEGNGRFTDVTETAGIVRADGAGLGVTAGDYNGDGWLDLYVANDATPNQLWINRSDGTFVDEGVLSGAAFNAAGNPEGSMGIASGDVDADGDEDLFVTNIIGETFALYENDGKGNFEDRRARVGAGAADRRLHRLRHRLDRLRQRRLARSVRHQRRRQHRRGAARPAESVPHEEPAVSQHRQGQDSSRRARPPGRHSRAPRSAAARRSATSTTTATSTSWSRTTAGRRGCCSIRLASGNHWLQVRVQQPGGNRFGVGRLGWTSNGRASPTLWRRVKTDGSYLSASDLRVHFGLGTSASFDAVTVRWPDGRRERWPGGGGDRVITLRQSQGRAGRRSHPLADSAAAIRCALVLCVVQSAHLPSAFPLLLLQEVIRWRGARAGDSHRHRQVVRRGAHVPGGGSLAQFARLCTAASLVALVAVFTATAIPTHAQTLYGTITGTVTDTQGSNVPGATVTAQK